MDNVKSCLEHIQFLLRAIGGRITNEQIQLLLVSHDLDEDEQQKKRLFELLDKNKIIPISEEERHPKVQVSNVPTQPKIERKEDDKELRNARCKKYFDELREKYREAIKERPNVAKLFEIEKPIFIDAIIAPEGYIGKTASQRIARAVISISKHRQREELKNGWLCGTYMRRVIERLERWIRMVFTEEQLSELICCILEGKELNIEQNDMVDILLCNAPGIIVHPRFRRSDLDD